MYISYIHCSALMLVVKFTVSILTVRLVILVRDSFFASREWFMKMKTEKKFLTHKEQMTF